MLQEVLTAVLKREHRDAGLYLEEDEDFVYLKHGETTLATWYGRSATPTQIWEAADRYLIADNMEDYWKHLRCFAH